ncbi:MAG: endopeptidase La, partial [Candidatus Sumerlaeota bacterium]|nr:endopeptidase La [Candidatus Sumerlaeota bacterium]
LIDFFSDEAYLKAYVLRLAFPVENKGRIEALRRTVLRQFEVYAGYSDRIPEELLANVKAMQDPLLVANSVSNYAGFSLEDKQTVLEAETVDRKLLLLSQVLMRENEFLAVESKILNQVRGQINKSQKEYFLNEQLKIIEKELGMTGEEEGELDEIHQVIAKSRMSQEAKEKAMREVHRLSRMAPLSPEATVSRSYVDWLMELPWGKRTKDKLDVARAQAILDQDHYGLEKVKERVVEYLAVLQLVKEMKGPILCLVGPPGTGKTSLARSVARALGRKFVRISLGGVRDEAEIRGHRRTYIGSLPGKILQWMKKAGSMNPVFLLDEVDKMSADFRGDPAAALLEVLDPEQNKAFNDHYLEVDFDLSQVMFITTANTVAGIPPALLDRMELIRLPGYTELEKRQIARRFLVRKQMKAHGLTRSMIRIEDGAIRRIIGEYTREAGVRQLEREIAAICRKTARQMVGQGERQRIVVNAAKARELLGPPKFHEPKVEMKPEIGVAIGLAWTEVGGELLHVETTTMKGDGKLILTGQLGDVMQESAEAAFSFIRAHAEALGAPLNFHKSLDIHIHIPEGAIPKDGPSAGVAMLVSMVSALSGRPVSQEIAMTGEITLRGKVLKIGGLKEKALAAHRNRIGRLLVPEENAEDLEDLPEEARKDLRFVFMATVDKALEEALAPPVESAKPPTAKLPTPKPPKPRPAKPSRHFVPKLHRRGVTRRVPYVVS